MTNCKKCGKETKGFKCDVDTCGMEAEQHDANHACGGEHCVPKCSACNEAETKCTCSAE
ncbi:hypothetical protein HY416_00205 [Candidatus Kaiserbacteria bacterium]|nr:hypothetical protein [Candidatus Kaiserbacteria bacterium]